MNSKKITLSGMTIAAFLATGFLAACNPAKKTDEPQSDKAVKTDTTDMDKKEGSCGEGSCG